MASRSDERGSKGRIFVVRAALSGWCTCTIAGNLLPSKILLELHSHPWLAVDRIHGGRARYGEFI
jgi:hypothetical protein